MDDFVKNAFAQAADEAEMLSVEEEMERALPVILGAFVNNSQNLMAMQFLNENSRRFANEMHLFMWCCYVAGYSYAKRKDEKKSI